MARVALVTGGSAGIGLAIAKALKDEGWSVVVMARRADVLERVAGDMDWVAGDVTSRDDVQGVFDHVSDTYGRLDLLVNNAGISVNDGIDIDVDAFRRVLDVNVVGCFLCAQFAFRVHVKRIINVGSISATAPRKDSTAYTTSKFALDGLTRSLALDGRPRGIAVGIIHPGNVQSDLLSPEMFEQRRRTEGLLRPSDVANAVVLMANMPPDANVLELTVMPTNQPLVGRG